MLNEELARALFPDGQAVGKCVLLGNDACRDVVGVVEVARRGPLRHSQLDSEFFVPFREHGEAVPQLLLVRPAATSGDAMTAIAAAVRSVSTELPYITIATLANLVDVQARSWRMGATIFGLFGTLAVVLAGIGVYATAAFSVRERTGEFGVRIALGARRRDVMALVVRHAALVLAGGSVLGAVAAWAVGGALQTVFVSVSRTDVRAFAAAAAILATACIAGCRTRLARGTRGSRGRAQTPMVSDEQRMDRAVRSCARRHGAADANDPGSGRRAAPDGPDFGDAILPGELCQSRRVRCRGRRCRHLDDRRRRTLCRDPRGAGPGDRRCRA